MSSRGLDLDFEGDGEDSCGCQLLEGDVSRVMEPASIFGFLITIYPPLCMFHAVNNIFLFLEENSCPTNTNISEFNLTPSTLHSVTKYEIITILREEETHINPYILRFHPKDYGEHYLCSFGSMDMHIKGIPDCSLMDSGHWRYFGFMVYIQQ